MKYFLLFSSLILVALCNAQNSNSDNPNWSEQNRLQHLKNIHNENTWDTELFEMDKQINGLDMAGPFEIAAFPVPKYKLTGGMEDIANGYKDYKFSYNEKTLYMNAFYVVNNSIYQHYMGENADEVFFQIYVLYDSADIDANALITSRNYPDFMGQGYAKTTTKNIEFSAFITAEHESYAIVNTRLFNLSYGKTILIAPQPDGTLRSMQIDSPYLTHDDLVDYTKKMIKKDKVIKFFE